MGLALARDEIAVREALRGGPREKRPQLRTIRLADVGPTDVMDQTPDAAISSPDAAVAATHRCACTANLDVNVAVAHASTNSKNQPELVESEATAPEPFEIVIERTFLTIHSVGCESSSHLSVESAPARF